MNPEQQHKAIVEVCGCTAQKDSDGFWRAVDASGRMKFPRWISQENVWSVGFPDYVNDLNAANDRIKRLEEALRRIANQDYRGNRSTESQIAFDALKEAKP